MILNPFSLETLSISIVSVLGAVGLCMRGSRCKKIKCCCMEIDRAVDKVETDAVNNPENNV